MRSSSYHLTVDSKYDVRIEILLLSCQIFETKESQCVKCKDIFWEFCFFQWLMWNFGSSILNVVSRKKLCSKRHYADNFLKNKQNISRNHYNRHIHDQNAVIDVWAYNPKEFRLYPNSIKHSNAIKFVTQIHFKIKLLVCSRRIHVTNPHKIVSSYYMLIIVYCPHAAKILLIKIFDTNPL